MSTNVDDIVHKCQEYFVGDFDITPDESLCDTLDKVTAHYERTGKILVWSGASDNTIFAKPETNHRFRAWHDWIHVVNKLPFDYAGEMKALAIHKAHVHLMWCRGSISYYDAIKIMYFALDIEIREQLNFHKDTGYFPDNQRKFTIDFAEGSGYLLN